MTNIGIIVGIVILGSAIVLVFIGSRYPSDIEDDIDLVVARLAEATQRGETVSLEDMELQESIIERILFPIIERVGDISLRFTPQKLVEEIELKLERAGNPGRIDVATFLATRFVSASLFGGGLLWISRISSTNWSTNVIIFIVCLFTLVGFFFPQLWLQSRTNARQKEVRKALPDALDLLTVCIEAGLGFDAAMSKVAEKWNNEISLIFARTIREIQLGKKQREALRDMADRVGLPELTSFVAAVIPSQMLGVSMAKLLRIQSDDINLKQKERVLNEFTTIDNWSKALFFILFGPVFILWFTWPVLIQILSTSPK